MIRCSAPGKIFLSGEYAVLSGSPAVVSAVDRRAVAEVTNSPDLTSELVLKLHAHTADYFETAGRPLPGNLGVTVSSSGFRIGKNKLGLGSSAAVAAGTVGALFELSGLDIPQHRADILEVAKRGHRASQGGKGSGADVACAVVGGTIVYTLDAPPVPVRLDGLVICVVWSGRSVSTAEMIAKIQQFKAADPTGYDARMAHLSQGAEVLARAFEAADHAGIITGTRNYAEGMDALGASANVPIVTKPHRRLINLAEELGGAAKPSGAGGGDIAVAIFRETEAAEAFRVQCIRHELPALDLNVDAPGLVRDLSPSPGHIDSQP